jgi:CheY-like chemotaxis protein
MRERERKWIGFMGQTLLIAEDDEKDRVLLVHALESAGVTNPIKLVKSGAELTKYLMGLGPFKDRVEHPLPGLILLDMNLNGMRGIDVMRFIRSEKDLSQVAIVILTGSEVSEDIIQAQHVGIKCYLVKPDSPDALTATMRGMNDYLVKNGLPAVLEFKH